MRSKAPRTALSLILLASLSASSPALAHPITVDGDPTDWMSRSPNGDNLGMVVRDAQGRGEVIWRDTLADTRTDISTPEVVADIAAFQVTGDANGVAFLLRRPPGVSLAGAPIQVQIAVDLDRVDGSGQQFMAGFADTQVGSGARWERLVQTLFGSGGTATVLDTAFSSVAMVSAVQGAAGDVEIFVPWTALGLNGPPSSPIRFTVATFRAQVNDLTIDVGGAMFSNALDVVSDYGDPRASMHPNTFQDVQDLIVDYSFDVHFGPTGEVYSPLVVQRFLPNSPGGGPDEWYAITNVSPAAFPLGSVKLGDEETPDGAEGMLSFPAAASVASGATYIVARSGSAYQTFYGVAPDAEMPPGASMAVPDMTVYAPWAGGSVQLANAGDELLVLDRSNLLVDVATFGNVTYTGITTFTPAPGTSEVLSRNLSSADTDDCSVDFDNTGATCTADAQCGGVCFECESNTCQPKAMGSACPNANPCDGDEVCDGNGACVAGMAPPCEDNNPCTTDSCTPAMGCMNVALPSGTSCADADVCNGDEVCDAAAACLAGMPLDCDDLNDCTADTCDAITGCANDDEPMGTPCEDGDLCTTPDTCDGAGGCTPGAMDGCGGAGGGGGGGGAGGAGMGGAGMGGAGMGGAAMGGAGMGGAAVGGAGMGGASQGGEAQGGEPPQGGEAATGGGGSGADDAVDDGCGCRVAGATEPGRSPGLAWLAAAVVAAGAARRRRRSPPGRCAP
ncbi:MAG: hypothetical protein IPM79_23370 [Polyangiaceae bacterium]|nr:hypothetical protein [Polyangiaceae bacterium]